MEELMPSTEVVLETTVIPATTWTESLYFLNDIVDKMEMPQVVKVEGNTENWELTKHIDLRQPFLVYSRRRRTKLFGELLWWDEGKKAWLVDGPLLEIPKDYTGWFEIVQNEGDKLSAFPSAYTTLGQVAEDGCQKLLVRSTMIGHSYTEDSNGLSLKEETTIFPGELLEMCGVAKRKWKIKEKISSLTKEPETKFLKCTDHRNKPVCFPLGHPGQFSPVFDQGRGGGGNSKNAVYQVMDLLEESMTYPIHVRLVFGWMPNNLSALPRTWQGVMSLIGSRRPDTVVMCNLSAYQNKMPLLEVPIDMDMRVRVAENKPMFSKDPDFRQLMKRCYSMVYPFLTSIKYFNIRYKRRDLSTTGDSNGSHKQTSRMAAPVDMSSFNPLDIFPPLARAEDVSDSWALSFKDPDFDYNNDTTFGGLDISTLSLNTTQSSTSTDASDVSLLRTHNRAQRSRQSVSGQAGHVKASSSSAADPKQRRQAANVRAMKERQISNREATC